MADEPVTIETQEVPLGEASMAEYKKAIKDGKETATRETITAKPEEAEEVKEQKPKVKGGFQARIDRLIKQQASTEERAAAAEKKAAELEAKLKGDGVTKTEQADGEPKRDAFQSDAEYLKAFTRWEVKQEMKAEREAEQKAAFEEQIKEARKNYNTRMIALQNENPELKELLAQDISVPPAIEAPILYEMDNGPEVTMFLAQNPEVCQELMEMPPSRAIAEVWKISEKLAAGKTEETDEEKAEKEAIEAEEQEKAIKAAEIRKRPPAPIKPVSGGSSRSTIPLDKTDYQAYKKLRSQGRVQ